MRKARSESKAPAERRHHRRTHVLFSGRLISGDRSASGVLFDISAGGARMRISEPLEPRSALTLRLASRLDFHVEVAWREGNMIGLKFREAPARIAATLAGLLQQDSVAA